jgi:hypothetical protein
MAEATAWVPGQLGRPHDSLTPLTRPDIWRVDENPWEVRNVARAILTAARATPPAGAQGCRAVRVGGCKARPGRVRHIAVTLDPPFSSIASLSLLAR